MLVPVNAPVGVPTRKGVIHQTVFIGPGSRHAENLEYVPCRLSLAPRLYEDRFAPDILLLHTSTPHNGAVSMGIEVQVLPAALESAKRGGAVAWPDCAEDWRARSLPGTRRSNPPSRYRRCS